MKKDRLDLGTGYISPVAVPVEFSSEGMLCTSFGNEEFEGSENYGNADDKDKGWY